jgi:aminoglycoside phosphotransferase family enzyme
MYMGVIPVTKSLTLDNDAHHDEIIDYAVQMKRMDNNKEMHKMLAEDKIPHTLFGFYKSYRANVRAKVTILSLKEDSEDEKKREDAKNYIQLMKGYCNSY